MTRVVVCSGKVYYDLLEKRRAEEIKHIAIIRIEQSYPFPYQELSRVLGDFPKATELVWCQEEPKNQGAWFITRRRLVKSKREGMALRYAGSSATKCCASCGLCCIGQKTTKRISVASIES